jgi:hypothetical protein
VLKSGAFTSTKLTTFRVRGRASRRGVNARQLGENQFAKLAVTVRRGRHRQAPALDTPDLAVGGLLLGAETVCVAFETEHDFARQK